MTGTDHTQLEQPLKESIRTNRPVIVLVNPQMGENIGAAARAMLNCGLDELRLVNPRDGWPNERAEAMSSGALAKMKPVKIYKSTADAVADCHFTLATTARPRDMVKPVYNGEGAAQETADRLAAGQKAAFLFGGERSGLDNDDIALSHAIITIPLNPGFSSLNLGQAVLLMSYEWSKIAFTQKERDLPTGDSIPASHDVMDALLNRLEDELDARHFFRSEGLRPTIVRNLRNLFMRTGMTEQEASTFHGIISALTGKKAPLRKTE